MEILLSQIVIGGSFVSWAIIIVVLAGIIGIVLAALRYFGVTVPPLLITCFWIVLGVIICVLAIRIIASVAGIG